MSLPAQVRTVPIPASLPALIQSARAIKLDDRDRAERLNALRVMEARQDELFREGE